MEKTCKTCISLCNKRGEVEGCDRHRSEVQEMIKEIDKILEEGYLDFERYEIGGNKMYGNKSYFENIDKEKQRQENILEYQRKFFKKKLR